MEEFFVDVRSSSRGLTNNAKFGTKGRMKPHKPRKACKLLEEAGKGIEATSCNMLSVGSILPCEIAAPRTFNLDAQNVDLSMLSFKLNELSVVSTLNSVSLSCWMSSAPAMMLSTYMNTFLKCLNISDIIF